MQSTGCTKSNHLHYIYRMGTRTYEHRGKQADQAAKAAAMSNTNPPTIKMKLAQNRSIQSVTNTQWETEWKTGKENAKRLRAMSQYPGTTTGPKLYGELQRKHVVWIARLRTGHCHLNE